MPVPTIKEGLTGKRACNRCKKKKLLSRKFFYLDHGKCFRPYCIECSKKASTIWRRLNKDKHSKFRRTFSLKSRYNLTAKAYDELLFKQRGVCAICKSPPSLDKHFKFLFVDHDHNSGQVRGLLCQKCNFGIGQFNDDISLLKLAIKYLQRMQKV